MMTYEGVTFPARDGVTITADHYPVAAPKATMILCHRSHYNRGEYRDSAPRLQALGYDCLAIDQRSGMTTLGVINETSRRAKELGFATGYLDARIDIESAIDYVGGPVILVGSSYSAALALLIGATNPLVQTVVAYSPGEYLKRTVVRDVIADSPLPIYATSARGEVSAAKEIVGRARNVTRYEPQGAGAHGARVLWSSLPDHDEYWRSLELFLSGLPQDPSNS